jgi:hypothetical protein
MNYITNSFLDDDELFSLFAIDDNPPLQRSKSFRLNVSNSLVELLGIKGNMLAFRKLTQGKDRVLVKVGIDSTIDIESRLQKLEFAPCPRSTREGFNEFQRVVRAPDGYTQQSDLIPTIWRSWWPIAKQTLNGRAVVLVFHEGNWLDVHKIETGVNPTIFTKLPAVEISASTAIPWAIDTRHLKVQKVQIAAANQSPLHSGDERSWLQETSKPKEEPNLARMLQEIGTIGDRWLATINSLPDNRTNLLTESQAIEQHKSQLVKTLEYLVVLSKEQP